MQTNFLFGSPETIVQWHNRFGTGRLLDRANDKKSVYRFIVNSVHEQVSSKTLTLAKVMLLQEQPSRDQSSGILAGNSPARSLNALNFAAGTGGSHPMEDLEGCSLLHLACETADIGMVELLLKYGAYIKCF